MKKQITIICGHDTDEAREKRTLDWLAKRGATVEEFSGLQVVTMTAEMDKGQYNGEYYIGYDDPEGNQEQSSLRLSLEPDPYESSIDVRFDGSYSCTCFGHGCSECNDEQSAIAKGENPYAHHISK